MCLQIAILTSYTADLLSKVLKDVENSIETTMFHVKHSEKHYDTSVSRETTIWQLNNIFVSRETRQNSKIHFTWNKVKQQNNVSRETNTIKSVQIYEKCIKNIDIQS